MNEMMEGWRAESKNGMVQSEPVTVIPPSLPTKPSSHCSCSSWTSVSAARLHCCQSAPLEIMQQVEELAVAQMDRDLDGGRVGKVREYPQGKRRCRMKELLMTVWRVCSIVSLFVSLQLENTRGGRYKTN